MSDVSLGLVREVLRGVFTLVAKIDRDMTGWICMEPVKAEEGEFEPVLTELLLIGETSVNGEKMVRRAKELGIFTGLRHAEAMLRKQDKIPADWRKYYLVFSEVWQSPIGNRFVFYLYWNGRHWGLDYDQLANAFYSRSRLLSSRKYL